MGSFGIIDPAMIFVMRSYEIIDRSTRIFVVRPNRIIDPALLFAMGFSGIRYSTRSTIVGSKGIMDPSMELTDMSDSYDYTVIYN